MIAFEAWKHPLVGDKVSWTKRQMLCIWFFDSVTKFYWLTFEMIFMALAALESCHVTFSWQSLDKTLWFWRFFEHILRTLSGLVVLRTRLKIAILAVFWYFFLCSTIHRFFNQKNRSNVCTFTSNSNRFFFASVSL